MVDLNPVVRKQMNDYTGNRDFSISARGAADRLRSMITKAGPNLAALKAEMVAQEFGFDSHGQAFWQGQPLPLALDRDDARKLAAVLRDIEPAKASK